MRSQQIRIEEIKEIFATYGGFNAAPWASVPPANRENAAREVAATLEIGNKKSREKLQSLEEQFGKLERELEQFCDRRALDEAEAKINGNLELSGEEASKELEKIRNLRAGIPQLETRIRSQQSVLRDCMKPAALEVLFATLERVRLEISRDFEPPKESQFWGVQARAAEFAQNWLIYPLQRLESILVSEIYVIATRPALEHAPLVRLALIDSGVIEPRARH